MKPRLEKEIPLQLRLALDRNRRPRVRPSSLEAANVPKEIAVRAGTGAADARAAGGHTAGIFPKANTRSLAGTTTRRPDVQPAAEAQQPFSQQAEPQSEESADVIVLPGESLAKYRLRAEHAKEPRPESVEAIDREEPHEHLVAAAEELEMADRIFSHRDGDSVEAEENSRSSSRNRKTEPDAKPSRHVRRSTHRIDTAPIYRGEDEFSARRLRRRRTCGSG